MKVTVRKLYDLEWHDYVKAYMDWCHGAQVPVELVDENGASYRATMTAAEWDRFSGYMSPQGRFGLGEP